MIVDTSAYIGHWPFRQLKDNAPDSLAKRMSECGVTHALLGNINSFFYRDAQQGNIELYEALKLYRGGVRFLPFALINPAYPRWEKDARAAIGEMRFAGIELSPQYHGYSVREQGAEALKLAAELGVPVRILGEFENIRERSPRDVFLSPTYDEIADAAQACPDTVLILNSFERPASMGENLLRAVKGGNIYFDCNRLDTFYQRQFEKALEAIGAQSLCYGSRAPLLYLEPTLAAVHYAPLTEGQRDMILFENIKKALKLS